MEDKSWYYCNACNRWWQICTDHTHYTHINPIEYKRRGCPECFPAKQEIVQPEASVVGKRMRKLTKEQKNDLIQDLKTGTHQNELAKKYQIAQPTVYYYYKKYCLESPQKTKTSSDPDPENTAETPSENTLKKEPAHTLTQRPDVNKNDELLKLKETNKFLYKSIQEKNFQIGKLDSELSYYKRIHNTLPLSDKEPLEQCETLEPTNNEIIKTLIKENSFLIKNIITLVLQITGNKDGTHERKTG